MPPTTPTEYRTVTPYLKLPNSDRLVEFLKNAFGATEKDRLLKPDGYIAFADPKPTVAALDAYLKSFNDSGGHGDENNTIMSSIET
jgi:uncharacterized glyoxalase superfamily protein PhnB